jgi:hypothetical protein
MMIGTVPTSIPQIILLGNWLLEMDFARKGRELKQNKLFWILSSVFFIHVLGLFYTSDMEAGINDIRTKSPLLILPMVMLTTRTLSLKEFHILLYSFIIGCFANTAWCYVYTFILHHNQTVRSASRFMSHIRLGLYLNMAICACVYLSFQMRNLLNTLVQLSAIIYFLFIMYALGLASGFANFLIVIFLMSLYFVFRRGTAMKISVLGLLVLTFFGIGSYVNNVYCEQFTVKESPTNLRLEKTASGQNYYHYAGEPQLENGFYVQYNIHFNELRRGWNRMRPNDTLNINEGTSTQRLHILLRYMSSMGLTKDSVGFAQLKDQDIENVKSSITNYKIPDWSYFHKRVYELVNEYEGFKKNRHGNASGHSLNMRLYFWKTACHVIKQNILFGVGTGDVQAELNKAYEELKVPLEKEWYKRPHNQFLTVFLAVGIIALIIFLISIFLPAIQLRSEVHILYWPFFVMAIVSFLMEDTLESQAGLTFYAFFNTVFISLAYHKKISEQA